MKNKKLLIGLLTVFLTLIIDQGLKIYIKLNYYYNQEVSVIGDWFTFLFVENRGMAFGFELPFLSPFVAKMLLSIFRVVAVGFIGYYLLQLIKRNIPTGLILSVALIFAGALGNILDSAFYGLIFSESTRFSFEPAHLVPIGEGYAAFLTGNVVDMFKVDLFTVDLPWYGTFNFFAPIFNFADVAISTGVGIIIVFQRKNFQKEFFNKKEEEIIDSPESDSSSEASA